MKLRLGLFVAFIGVAFVSLFRPKDGQQLVQDYLDNQAKRNRAERVKRMMSRRED